MIDDNVNRRFFTFSAQMVGPVFNRVWDTPDNGYAQKFKHSVEPFFNVARTSSIDNADRIVQLESIDYTTGGNTNYTYGVRNRFYAKSRQEAGRPSTPREIVSVELTQRSRRGKVRSVVRLRGDTPKASHRTSSKSPPRAS